MKYTIKEYITTSIDVGGNIIEDNELRDEREIDIHNTNEDSIKHYLKEDYLNEELFGAEIEIEIEDTTINVYLKY